MTNLSLQDRFSLISLNALNSTRNSTAKKVAIRCISAAGVLDRFLQETEELTEDSDEYRSRLDALSVSLKEAAHLSSSAAKELEHTVYTRLNNLGLMTEASSLVSCDLEFSSAGNKILEYRTDSDEYSRQTESLRAELMEEGNVFDETVCMLWLLRESSCFYDLFSKEEQKYLRLIQVWAYLYYCYSESGERLKDVPHICRLVVRRNGDSCNTRCLLNPHWLLA